MNEAIFGTISGDFIPTLNASASQKIEFGARDSLFKKRLTYDVAYYNMQIDNELVTETRDFTPIARNEAKQIVMVLRLLYLIKQLRQKTSKQLLYCVTVLHSLHKTLDMNIIKKKLSIM